MTYHVYRFAYDPVVRTYLGQDYEAVRCRSALELLDLVLGWKHTKRFAGLNQGLKVILVPATNPDFGSDYLKFDQSRAGDPEYVEEVVVACWEVITKGD